MYFQMQMDLNYSSEVNCQKHLAKQIKLSTQIDEKVRTVFYYYLLCLFCDQSLFIICLMFNVKHFIIVSTVKLQ